ncbi:MAG: TolC family protein [Steroidobacteraceae bacterium]
MPHRWMSLARALAVCFLAAAAAMTGPQSSVSAEEEPLGAPLTADAFTDAVLAHNASLEAMRQAVVAAVEQVRPAGALDDPMLSVSAAPRSFGTAGGTSGDVEVSQSFPWWGTLDARREVARADAEAMGRNLDALRLRLATTARGAFADWVYVHRALDINTANLSVLDELRNVARIRYATGQAPQEDVLQADVEHTMLKQQRLEWERDLIVAQSRMNALLDRAPQSAIPPPAGLPAASALPAEQILAQRALAHPQLEELADEERSAEERQRLAEKERFPKFGVSVGYNNMWADPAMRPMVGLSFTLPIDQGKYRATIDAAHAQARRAASTLEDQRASLLASLSADYAAVREAARSVALYRDELVPLAQSTLDVSRAEYGTGRGDFLNVMTAEQHRLDTELGLARMQSRYFQSLAELDRASGGGLLEPRSALAPAIP